MFKDKVNGIFALLEVNSADVARAALCDKSHISRMASGARVPKNGKAGARRLVNGIYLCADEKGKVDELCRLIGCGPVDSADKVKEQIALWLYDNEKADAGAATRKESVPFRALGEKIGAVMELTNLSNVRLGRSLNLDPSYISRFRNGFRSPKSNPKMMNDICALFLERAAEQNKLGELAKLTHESAELFSDRDKAFDALYAWLYNDERTDFPPFVEGLIEGFGSFSGEIKKPPLSFSEAADGYDLSGCEPIYYGTDGLRRAVILFLGNVIERKEKELFLYSDQNMDWIVDDREFFLRWASLMAHCVANGTTINIIHNVDRDFSEMAEAIKSWAPLYLSGKIRSYYCKSKVGERFSTTLFLCPAYACISGCSVSGVEGEFGLYRFDTDPSALARHEAAYRELLGRSAELVRVHYAGTVGRLGDPDITSLAVLGNTLSLATMPEKTLMGALLRTGADDSEISRVLDMRKQRLAVFERGVECGFLHEFIPLPQDKEIGEGGVFMDIPGLSVAYTKKEYSEHIANVIALSERHNNYRFCILPESPFEDMKILVSDRAVAVTRLKEPHVTILLEHPDLCRAFVAYARRIREKYMQDKLTTKKLLERYL